MADPFRMHELMEKEDAEGQCQEIDINDRAVRDAIESAAETTFGVNRSVQVWNLESNFARFARHLTDHLQANIEAETGQ